MTSCRSAMTAATLAMLLLLPAAAVAWGSSGHRITAQIAQNHLTPGPAKALAELTGGRSLALLATWPDFIRSDTRWDCIQPWHYLTVEDGQDFDQALAISRASGGLCSRLFSKLEMPNNVVSAIEYFTAIVRGDKAKTRAFAELLEETRAQAYAESTRLTALILLVHFVGDVHQPLHVGRGGDRGGNNVSANWFGEVSKLHSVWDSGLIDGEGLSYSEFVAFLEQEHSGQGVEYGAGPTTWAQESITHRHRVYEIWNKTSRDNHLPDLSYEYSAAQIGLVKQRLYWGGRRLATLLNSVFD